MASDNPLDLEQPFVPSDKQLALMAPFGPPLTWLKTGFILGRDALMDVQKAHRNIGGESQYHLGEAIAALDQLVMAATQIAEYNMQEQYAWNMTRQQQLANLANFSVTDRPNLPDQDIPPGELPLEEGEE